MIKKYKSFVEGLSITDENLPTLVRTKPLSDVEFMEIFNKECKNFSFSNDLLWRGRVKKHDLELFNPSYRRASPLAFPKFFNKIEDDPNFPVIRKKSLIGGTNLDILRHLTGVDIYLIIPFDNSQIVFCPIIDMWGMDDERRKSSEIISGKPVSGDNFIMKSYTPDFRVPIEELKKLPKSHSIEKGVEFFTSSPCLMVHEKKIDWFKEQLGK